MFLHSGVDFGGQILATGTLFGVAFSLVARLLFLLVLFLAAAFFATLSRSFRVIGITIVHIVGGCSLSGRLSLLLLNFLLTSLFLLSEEKRYKKVQKFCY